MGVAAVDACIVSIDLPGGIHGGGYEEDQIPFFLRAFPRGKQRLHLIRADSALHSTVARVQKILNGNRLDYLFIDGDHRYEAVLRDFLLYAPLVRPGGIIAFHDIVERSSRPDVQVPQLWSEIKNLAPSIDIIARMEKPGPYNAGLGIFVDWQPEALAQSSQGMAARLGRVKGAAPQSCSSSCI
jgi:hypothetical protein